MTHAALKDLTAAKVVERVRNALESHRKGLPEEWQDFIAEQVRGLSNAIAALSAVEGEALKPFDILPAAAAVKKAMDDIRTAPPPQQAEQAHVLDLTESTDRINVTPSPGPQGGGEALGRILAYGEELKQRDRRREIAAWNADYMEVMSRRPEGATPPAHQPGEVVTDAMVELALAAWFEHEGEPLCIANYRVSKDENARRLPIRMAAALTAALAPKEDGHG